MNLLGSTVSVRGSLDEGVRRVRLAFQTLLHAPETRAIDPALIADSEAASTRIVAPVAPGRPRADVFQKAYDFKVADQARKRGFYPYFRALDHSEGAEAIIEGERVTMFGSNNYLGMTTAPEVRQAARDVVDRHGTGGPTAWVLADLYTEFERELAEFLGKEAVLVLSAGYLANVAAISSLLEDGRTVAVIDRNVHASIYEGARLAMAGGTRLVRYKHNNVASLEKALAQVGPDEQGLVITDGTFSAEGELAPLPEIAEAAQKSGARLIVDDAHGLGVVGPNGRGTAAHFGVTDKVDLITGTFSKTLASAGGWIAGDRAIIEYVRRRASAFQYATRLPASCVAAALAALRVLKKEPWRVEQLTQNFTYMRNELRRLGFDIGQTQTAVIPIYIRQDLRTLLVWKELLNVHRVYTNPFISPGVPPNHAMLRTSYMATHTREQLDRGLEAFAAVGKKFGVIT